MIVSHKYKFIFIKNVKVASSSMEIALSKFCGPDDIITLIDNGGTDDKTRKKLGYPGPQHHNGFWCHDCPAFLTEIHTYLPTPWLTEKI